MEFKEARTGHRIKIFELEEKNKKKNHASIALNLIRLIPNKAYVLKISWHSLAFGFLPSINAFRSDLLAF
jgi:hypothetical protein